MVDTTGEVKSSRSVCGKMSKFRDVGRENCFCSEQDLDCRKLFGNYFSTFCFSRNHPQRIDSCATPRERKDHFHKQEAGTSFTRDDKKIETQFRYQHLQEGPSTMSSIKLVANCAESFGLRQQIPELHCDKFQKIPNIFGFENEIQKSSDYLF